MLEAPISLEQMVGFGVVPLRSPNSQTAPARRSSASSAVMMSRPFITGYLEREAGGPVRDNTALFPECVG